MEATYHSEGQSQDYTNPNSITVIEPGTILQVGGRAAVLTGGNDLAASGLGALQFKGNFEIQAGAVTGAVGDDVWWDEDGNPYGGTAGSGCATTDPSAGDFWLGILTKALTATDGYAYVDLNVGNPAVFNGAHILGANIYVDADQIDDTGDGKTPASAFKTLASALAAVTASRKTILMMPGEYVQTESLLWPSISGIKIMGMAGSHDAVTITGLSGEDEVFEIDPTVQTATFEATLAKLTVSCPDGVDGITLDNNNVGRKLNLYLQDIAIENDTETDKAINVVHTVAGNAIRIYCDGQRGIIEGLLYIAPKNVDDRFTFMSMQFDGGMQFGTATIASVTTFKDCIVKDNGGAGGQDAQILNVLNCHSLTGTTYAIAALADFAAAAAEVILPAA